jgi:hypothetical protein
LVERGFTLACKKIIAKAPKEKAIKAKARHCRNKLESRSDKVFLKYAK